MARSRAKGGRPRIELTKEQRRRFVIGAGLEMTVGELAGYVGIAKRTLQRRIAESEELRELLEEGREAGRGRFLGMLHDLAKQGNHRALGALMHRYGIREPAKGVQFSGDAANPVRIVGASGDAERRFDEVLGLPSEAEVH